MAFGGRRKCVKLLAEGMTDPARLMAELGVGPFRLLLILESPTVRRWKFAVSQARELLDDVAASGAARKGGRVAVAVGSNAVTPANVLSPIITQLSPDLQRLLKVTLDVLDRVERGEVPAEKYLDVLKTLTDP